MTPCAILVHESESTQLPSRLDAVAVPSLMGVDGAWLKYVAEGRGWHEKTRWVMVEGGRREGRKEHEAWPGKFRGRTTQKMDGWGKPSMLSWTATITNIHAYLNFPSSMFPR